MKRFINLSFCLLLCFTFSSCLKTYKNVGYTFDEQKLDQIKINKSSSSFVKTILGSPSAKSEFGEDIWYYISTEYESIAFLDPKIKSQEIVALEFSDNVVSSIKRYDADNAKNISFRGDITKTGGQKLGTLEQLLGNIGKFNTGSL